MAIFYRGAGIGTYWHLNNPVERGFIARSPEMEPTTTRMFIQSSSFQNEKETLMKHIVDTVNKINFTIKPLELAGRVPFTDSIELLRVELQYQDGYGPLFMGRVRYALNGVEQEDGFPFDLHKGAFIATVPIQEAGLEEKLQEIGPEIAKIVYKDLAKQRRALA